MTGNAAEFQGWIYAPNPGGALFVIEAPPSRCPQLLAGPTAAGSSIGRKERRKEEESLTEPANLYPYQVGPCTSAVNPKWQQGRLDHLKEGGQGVSEVCHGIIMC